MRGLVSFVLVRVAEVGVKNMGRVRVGRPLGFMHTAKAILLA